MTAKDLIEVSDDHLLLQAVCESHNVTAKRLAMLSGRAASTIYKYMCGEATIPSVLWRALYAATKDERIVNLITGEVPVAVVELPTEAVRLDAATVKSLIECRRRALACEQAILEIIADGKVDADDRVAVERYNTEFPRLISSLYQTFMAINGRYEKTKGVYR